MESATNDNADIYSIDKSLSEDTWRFTKSAFDGIINKEIIKTNCLMEILIDIGTKTIAIIIGGFILNQLWELWCKHREKRKEEKEKRLN